MTQVNVPQSAITGWTSLGVFTFNQGTSGYVWLGDYTGETYATKQIGYDVIQWVPDGDSCGSWPGFSGCTAPGAGSSRQALFQQAVDRWASIGGLGCATGNAYWWNGIVRQDFEKNGSYISIMHDEGQDNPIYSVPAWVVWGGIRSCYLASYQSLGPPMSDEYMSSSGYAWSSFRHGYIYWNGACQAGLWWDGPGGWAILKPGQDTNASVLIESPPGGSPGTTYPIPGAKLVLDNNGGSQSWVDHPWIYRDIPDVSATPNSTVRWTQYDLAQSLVVSFSAIGTDGVDRWLYYAANAPTTWPTAGWVDMSASPSGYNSWLTYTRNVYNDYVAEYGVAPRTIRYLHIGHQNQDSWDGDHGGTVGGFEFNGVNVVPPAAPANVRGGPAANPNVPHSYEPVNLATGEYTLQATDVAIAGKGESLAFARSYASGGGTAGRMGYGWQDNLRARLQFDDPNPAIANVAVVQEEGRQDNYERLADASYMEPLGILDQLTRNTVDGTFTLSRKDRTKLHFGSAGALQSTEDRNGNLTTLTYGGGGLLTMVTDPSGRALTLAYDGSNRITSVTDPLGRVTTYSYNGAGDLISVTDPASATTSYTYDASHRMLTIVDPRGNTSMTNVYDSAGRVTQQTNARGNSWQFTYGIGTTTETDPRGCATTHTYDARFRETQVTNCLGGSASYSYDADGNRASVTDALGRTTTMTYDARGNLLTLADALGHVTSHTYSPQDDHLSQTDPLGRTTTYTYSPTGNLLTVTDPGGGVATFTYDAAGQLLTTTDPLGRTSTFGYNVNGYKISSTDALLNTSTFTYDAAGRMLTETDSGGHATSYTYDGRDRLLTKTDALGGVTTNTYDANGNATSVADPGGHTAIYTYDALNHPVTMTDAAGVVTYAYDSVGNRVSVTDPNLSTTTTTYDLLGRPTAVTDPLGNVTAAAYDAVGNVASRTDAGGATTTYVYDAVNQLVATTDALGAIATQTYDLAGQVATSTDPRGGVSSFAYNADGDQTSATDPLGNTTTFAYDIAGRMLSQTDPLGHTTTYAYDGLDRLVSTTDSLGNVTSNAYDADDNKSSSTDANGKVTMYAYDALHRLISETDPAGGIVTHAYDADGNQTAVTDANSHATTSIYDAAHRMVSISDPMGHTATTTYDAAGNPITRTDPNGAVTAYTYDAANRLLRKEYPGQPAVSYTYSATGQRLTMTDLTGVTTYAYDALRRLTSVTNPGGAVVSYAYDAAGNRSSLTYPDGKTVTFAHDAGQHLTGVTDWASRTTSYAYDAASRLTTATLPNGTASTRQYDIADRLLSIAHEKGVANLISIGYTLDNEGNRLSRTETTTGSLTDTYAYDNLYRITSANYGPASFQDQSFTYDPVGNRTQLVAGATTNYTYDAAGRLLTAGSSAFEFDDNGNQVRQGNRTFSYDREDRLLQVADWTSTPGGTCADTNWDSTVDSGDLLAIANSFNTRAGSSGYQPVLDPQQDGAVNSGDLLLTSGKFAEQCHVATASAYNGDGLRIYRSEGGATERYIWDVGAGLPVIIQTSTGTSFLYGQDLILEESAGTPTYYYQDGLGSTVMTADGAGAVTGTYAYDVYGTPRTSTPAFSYTGQQGDASGLLYMRARSYDSATGRFLSRDPVFTTSSLYTYVSNNPTLLTDPTGMWPWDGVKKWVEKKIIKPAIKSAVKVTAAVVTTAINKAVAPVWNKVIQPAIKTAAKVVQTAKVVTVRAATAVVTVAASVARDIAAQPVGQVLIKATAAALDVAATSLAVAGIVTVAASTVASCAVGAVAGAGVGIAPGCAVGLGAGLVAASGLFGLAAAASTSSLAFKGIVCPAMVGATDVSMEVLQADRMSLLSPVSAVSSLRDTLDPGVACLIGGAGGGTIDMTPAAPPQIPGVYPGPPSFSSVSSVSGTRYASGSGGLDK